MSIKYIFKKKSKKKSETPDFWTVVYKNVFIINLTSLFSSLRRRFINSTPIVTVTHRNEHILFLKLHQHPVYLGSHGEKGGQDMEREKKREKSMAEQWREGARWKQALQHGSHTGGRLINHGRRSPDEWEAAGKLLASLHQADVLKVSNQCSPRAPLLPYTPPIRDALSPCSPLHGVKASPPPWHCGSHTLSISAQWEGPDTIQTARCFLWTIMLNRPGENDVHRWCTQKKKWLPCSLFLWLTYWTTLGHTHTHKTIYIYTGASQ